jgi:DNA-binding response OmpR family regulator
MTEQSLSLRAERSNRQLPLELRISMTKKILIADDEPNMVMVISTRLKAHGYEVIEAHDGQMALDKARNEKPDLIILDLMLPKLNGYRVCALLKRDFRYSKIPIILFTAKTGKDDMALGAEVGADAYLLKPYRAEVLLGKVQELLGDEASPT